MLVTRGYGRDDAQIFTSVTWGMGIWALGTLVAEVILRTGLDTGTFLPPPRPSLEGGISTEPQGSPKLLASVVFDPSLSEAIIAEPSLGASPEARASLSSRVQVTPEPEVPELRASVRAAPSIEGPTKVEPSLTGEVGEESIKLRAGGAVALHL